MENILIIGGAGYIGSYMCKYLHKRGYQPVVLDNFITGHREAVKWGPLFEGDMADVRLLEEIFSKFSIKAVMHFAAFCYIGESVNKPAKYYLNNVAKTISLLNTMVQNNVLNFIFSSSCATYGEPQKLPIDERHSQNPINPYGRSKLMAEKILDDFKMAYGLNSVSLRYFNAAGADPDGELGEDHNPETHLIPLVLQTALGQREMVSIFGDDYDTQDGTCVRDYIHIDDLAQAHFLSLESLLEGSKGDKYNLGNAKGYSVKEVIEIASRVTGKQVAFKIEKKRQGDPAVLIGSSRKAGRELGWKPEFSELQEIIKTAWMWHSSHPYGYES